MSNARVISLVCTRDEYSQILSVNEDGTPAQFCEAASATDIVYG